MQLQNFTQLTAVIVQVRILRAVKAGPLVLCQPKMSPNGIRKAAAEDREHGVAQKSPINNVEKRLWIIINKRYHGNMYD